VVRTILLALVMLSQAAYAADPTPAGATRAAALHHPARAAASAAAPTAHATAPRPARAIRPKNGPVELYHVNHKETLLLRLRDERGRPVRGQQRRFDRFLRCHYTNVQHPMNPRLITLLYKTGRHWPGHRIEVVSGYRHPKVAKNPRSPHMKGLACDLRVVGVSNAQLRDYFRSTFDKVGVGYYPNSSFVHLDIRQDHSAFWIDYSGPGERALYSAAPGDDLKTGRADRFHPSKIDSSWVDDAAGGGDADSPPPPAERPAPQPMPAVPSESP
jgi:uncharacterized protein YcbK (DUF882 family)